MFNHALSEACERQGLWRHALQLWALAQQYGLGDGRVLAATIAACEKGTWAWMVGAEVMELKKISA